MDDDNNTTIIDKAIFINSVWLGGKGKKYPTIHIWPKELAEKYKLDKPCKIILQGMPEQNGVLIKFYKEGLNGKAKQQQKGQQKEEEN